MKLRALCGRSAPGAGLPSVPAARPAPTRSRRGNARIDAAIIGVSTGGPSALADLVPALPVDLPVPVLIVQHMPPVFTQMLAERLDGRSALRVVEATEGESVVAGTVYLAPGGRHLAVERRTVDGSVRVRLHDEPPENSCRPAVDVLFRSAVDAWGEHLLGVVLTGMGQDGLRGSELVVEAGGAVLAQDEATSVVWGMPGFVARHGLAEAVLPLGEMPAAITQRILRTHAVTARPIGASTR